jgi:predicted MFS family arabinose efflux permease
VLIVLTSVSFFNYLDRMALAVLIEPIKRDLHLTDTQIGMVTGLAFALFYASLGIPIARLADRGNKAALLGACIALWSTMTAVSAAAGSFLTIFLARVGVGIGESGCVPTSFAIISDRFPPERRPLAMSVFQAGGLLGISLGVMFAGVAGQFFGWRLTLAAIGLAGLPVALLVVLTLGGRSTEQTVAERRNVWTDLGELMRRPAYFHIVIGISLAAFATYSVMQWLAAFFVRSHGTSLAVFGVVSGLSTGVGGIAGTLAGGSIGSRLMRRNRDWDLRLPMISYALAAPLFAMTFIARGEVAGFVFNVLATCVAASAGGVALSAVQRFTEPERRATANALMLMVSAVFGVGLGPFAVGVASDLLRPLSGGESLRWALAMVSAAFLWSALHFKLALRSASRTALSDVPASDPRPTQAV